jgi:hypothetical protein
MTGHVGRLGSSFYEDDVWCLSYKFYKMCFLKMSVVTVHFIASSLYTTQTLPHVYLRIFGRVFMICTVLFVGNVWFPCWLWVVSVCAQYTHWYHEITLQAQIWLIIWKNATVVCPDALCKYWIGEAQDWGHWTKSRLVYSSTFPSTHRSSLYFSPVIYPHDKVR